MFKGGFQILHEGIGLHEAAIVDNLLTFKFSQAVRLLRCQVKDLFEKHIFTIKFFISFTHKIKARTGKTLSLTSQVVGKGLS